MPAEPRGQDAGKSVRADRFTWERALLNDAELGGTRLLVLFALATYMGPNGDQAHPGHGTLAASTRLAERTVRHHLAGAVKDGWLKLVTRGHRVGDVGVASHYHATIPTGSAMPVGPVDSASQPAAPCRLGESPTGGAMPVGPVDSASQPAPTCLPTGTHVPPTIYDHEYNPPYPPGSVDNRGLLNEENQEEAHKVDDVLAAWVDARYRHAERTTGVRHPDRFRRKLADEVNEHRARVIELAARCPTATVGQLVAVLEGNNALLRALEETAPVDQRGAS